MVTLKQVLRYARDERHPTSNSWFYSRYFELVYLVDIST